MLNDESKLLVFRLKDTVLEELKKDMEQDIGTLYDFYEKKFNEHLITYVNDHLKYFSTTEIKTAYWHVMKGRDGRRPRDGLLSFTDVAKIKELDPWLDLEHSPTHHRLLQIWKTRYAKNTPSYQPGTSTTNSSQLKNLMKQIRASGDPRKMRRLKRKEKYRLKKGVRLFDTNEQV